MILQLYVILKKRKDKQPTTHLAGYSQLKTLVVVNATTSWNVALINTIKAKDFELKNDSKILIPSILLLDVKFAGETNDAVPRQKKPGTHTS